MARPSTLAAPSQELVLGALRKHKKPLSAYGLLERLKKSGIKSPPIIYRALETLMRSGEVHKISSLNAFIACNCEADHDHSLSVLMVCTGCEKVEELHDHDVVHHLEKLRQKRVRLVPHAVIELPVTCDGCDSAAG